MLSLNGTKVINITPRPSHPFLLHRCHTLLSLSSLTLARTFLQNNTQVLSLNGTKVINMAQLVQLVDTCSEPFLHFHLDYDQKVCVCV